MFAEIRDLILILALLAAGVLVTTAAHSMAGFPPEDMTCKEEPFPNPSTQYIHCWFPPHISKFVTTGDDVAFPSALLVPRNPAGKVKIRAHFNGYTPTPFDICANVNFSDPAALVTKNCPEPQVGQQIDWGGPYHGELAYGWRIAATAKYATDHYPTIIDLNAGITLEGCSLGGTTAILQSLLMPDPWTKALITVVDACVPQTMMVEQTPPVGWYWKDPTVPITWSAFDWTKADIRRQATGRVYYHLVGSPKDNLVNFDLRVFPLVCDALQISCKGEWHDMGHVQGRADVNLQWFETYTMPGMSQRLNQPQIAITHFSENSPITADIGHWNMGIGWRDAGMVDRKDFTRIQLRYIAHKNIGGGVPDQLDVATFDATVRNTRQQFLAGDVVRWTFGSQSGTAIAEDGKVTITGLTLGTSNAYTNLEITR